MHEIIHWFRWLFKRCVDCGTKLQKDNSRGDVCEKCFADFDGMTIEEMMGE